MENAAQKSYLFLPSGFYGHIWLKLWIATLLVFLPFLFNFLWGNHDWEWIREGTPLFSGVFEGRFSQFILQNFLFEGRILPVFSIAAAFAFYSGAAVLLFRLWNLPPQKCIYLLPGLCLASSPYVISWLYFAFITLSSLSWVLVIAAAFYNLENLPRTHHPKLSFLAAVLLFALALGGYPPVINLMGVVFFTLVLQSLCLQRLSVPTLFRHFIPHCIALLSGIAIFLFAQYLLKKYHLQYDTYNTAGIGFTELPDKLLLCLQAAVGQFFKTGGFITAPHKYIGLCLFLLAIFRLWLQLPKRPANIALFFLSVAGLLFATVSTLLVARDINQVLYQPRIDFFGLPFIYAFSSAVLLASDDRLIRNITAFALSALIAGNVNTAAAAAKIWSQGFKAEMSFAGRVLTRLENTSGFSPYRKYAFVQGGTLDFRSRFLIPGGNITAADGYTVTAPYIPWHLPSKAYLFYYPHNFVAADFDVYWSYVDPEQISLTPGLISYLQDKAAPWPDAAAIYTSPRTIILTVSQDGGKRSRLWLQKELSGAPAASSQSPTPALSTPSAPSTAASPRFPVSVQPRHPASVPGLNFRSP